jgi:hypothetical protein
MDAVGHQLQQVVVAGDEHHLAARRLRPDRQGSQHVVGLVALHFVDGQVEGRGDLADDGDLRYQVIRRRRALGLVGGELLVAKGRFGSIEGQRHRVRRFLLPQPQQHSGKPVGRVRRLPVR